MSDTSASTYGTISVAAEPSTQASGLGFALALGLGVAVVCFAPFAAVTMRWFDNPDDPVVFGLMTIQLVPWLLVPWLLHKRFASWRHFAAYGVAFGLIAGPASGLFLQWRNHVAMTAFSEATLAASPNLRKVSEDEDKIVYEGGPTADGKPYTSHLNVYKFRFDGGQTAGLAAGMALICALVSLGNCVVFSWATPKAPSGRDAPAPPGPESE